MRTPEQEAELEEAKRLLEAAFDEEKPEDALEYLGKVGDIVGIRMRKRSEFNRKLDQAFEDVQGGEPFKTDPDTGKTIVPDRVAAKPLPTTQEVSLSGKGLADAISNGRVLAGPGPVPGATPWVRIAEDAPYTGPIIRITRTEAFVYASSFRLKDLMIALAQTFGAVLPDGILVTTSAPPGAPLSGDEKDKMIEMMAETIARLTIERDQLREDARQLEEVTRLALPPHGAPNPED